jgi:hypothetical protein
MESFCAIESFSPTVIEVDLTCSAGLIDNGDVLRNLFGHVLGHDPEKKYGVSFLVYRLDETSHQPSQVNQVNLQTITTPIPL